MSRQPECEILVIGIGNARRGDDAVGVVVAENLRKQALDGVGVVIERGEGAALIERFRQAGRVIMVDAVQANQAPGTVCCFDARRDRLPPRFFTYSTHQFGVAEAVEMARILGALPPQLIIYGIEGCSFDFGDEVSTEVKEAADRVTQDIIAELVPAR